MAPKINSIHKRQFTVCLLFMLMTITLQAQDWPQWRGPNANGVAEQGNYPSVISSSNNLLWEIKLPGVGGSTPIVWKDRIIITSGIGENDDAEDGVICFDWEGNQVWEVKLGKQNPGKHKRGSGSNPSAITNGERIFVLFKTTTLAALDFDGNVLWKTNLQDTHGEITFWWDFGTSPVLVEGNVVVAIMNEGQSYLLALEQSTGKVAWKVDRNYTCNKETAQSYTTPLLITEGDKTTIVVWGADHLTGHDATTGELIWSYSGFNPGQKQYWRTIASPAISDGVALVPYGRGRLLAGMKTKIEGDMTEKDFLWEKSGIGTDVATPIAIDGKVYILSFNGKLWCLDILTGEELWKSELPEVKGLFYSSPTLAGNMLYMCNDVGAFYVCEVSDSGIKVLTHTQFEDNFVASPVLVQNKLLLRGTKNLYCFGQE
ncbi:MAG: PQQ-like beta-propeller repeat protein [Bacteroidetes bacterium]|jgi:outer membrane protein assembly factor BamB|nr:PQQ-like beta-propeller repeat protein [Bacteroidota bacterium]MBT3750599.1 PQQ-like beta-propeller repeat protein [Bacteroidota bacterium]MBT4401448.1 PQQ-like beta-propeller repeat protein [Bacteroidota bacterium]MBT5427967.1 PQQ-like beta-propeller repeat protein [Bacteroidota bacterium]MBT7094502.1 PQQ-like beta-propeller repeat protein [Bacteroidota bacterium]